MKKIIIFILIAAIALSFASCGVRNEVIVISGPSGMGMAKLLDDGNYKYEIFSSPQQIQDEIIAGRYNFAAVPSNVAAQLYNKTNGDIKIIACGTKGVLYILGDVEGIEGLEGKTIYTAQRGALPEYVLRHILNENGINAEILHAELLQERFIIAAVVVFRYFFDFRVEKTADKGISGLKPGIQIQSADKGFQRVGQNCFFGPAAGKLLAFSQ